MVKKKGVTLIELTIVVAIVGIIFVIGPPLLVGINKFFFLNRARIEVQRDTRTCLEVINRELRQAQKNSITMDQSSISQPPYSRITFIKVNGTTSTVFYQSNKSLIMTTGASNNRIDHTLSTNLRFISFSFPDSSDMGLVSVSISMEKSTYQGLTNALHMSISKVRVMN